MVCHITKPRSAAPSTRTAWKRSEWHLIYDRLVLRRWRAAAGRGAHCAGRALRRCCRRLCRAACRGIGSMIRGTGRWICVAGCAPCSSAPVLGAGSSARCGQPRGRRAGHAVSRLSRPGPGCACTLAPAAGRIAAGCSGRAIHASCARCPWLRSGAWLCRVWRDCVGSRGRRSRLCPSA
jgi:hypothetical protein